jgi:REP element-mobilizing transposase RayT
MVEVTCRTIQGRMLLRPSAPLNEAIRGVLARAARLHGVEVHLPVFLSNHYHLLVSVRDAKQLAAFMNYLNSNLAREAGRQVRWREKFWGRRYQAVLVSNEEAAQVSRLVYLLAHGVKEGLVDSPLDWPGVHGARELVEGKPVSGPWRDRTLESRARRKGAPLVPSDFIVQEQLTLAPLPCWRSLDSADYRARVQTLIEEIEAWGRQRQEETGSSPLGGEAVCRQDPHHEPNRMKKAPAPLVHAVAPEVRRALRQAYFTFRDAFQRAARQLRAGVRDVVFPEGAFPPAFPVRLAARSG